MPVTSAEVLIEFIPTQQITTKCSSTNRNTNISDIANLMINPGSISEKDNFATLEHNIWLLDGTFRVLDPSSKPWGYFGREISDINCHVQDTTIRIILTASDNSNVSLGGITLNFGDDKYASSIEYTVQGAIYQQMIISPTTKESKIVFADSQDIKSITLNVRETKFPGMHPRVFGITLGIFYHFTDKDISSLVLNEEVSPISSVIPVNTASLSVISPTGEFDVVDSNIIPTLARNKSKVLINAIIDGEKLPLAEMLLDSWESKSKYELTFNFVSLTKELDDYTYAPTSMEIYDIEEHLNFLKGEFRYDVPDNTDLYYIYLKKGTYRELFQQVCFLYGMMSNDMLGNQFTITKLDQSKIKATLYPGQVVDDVKLTKTDVKNKIVVNTATYIDQAINGDNKPWSSFTYTGLYKGKINKSVTLEFKSPSSFFRYRLLKIEDNKETAVINANIGDVITINGNKSINQYTDGTSEWWFNNFPKERQLVYTFTPQDAGDIKYQDYIFEIEPAYFVETKSQYTVKKGNYPNENLLYIDKPDIFSSENVSEFAENTLNYYNNMDLKVEAAYVNTTVLKNTQEEHSIIRAGDTVYMYTDNNIMIKTTIVKQSIDLVNGFTTKMTGISNSESIYAHEYMTSDSNSAMYMNDNTLI